VQGSELELQCGVPGLDDRVVQRRARPSHRAIPSRWHACRKLRALPAAGALRASTCRTRTGTPQRPAADRLRDAVGLLPIASPSQRATLRLRHPAPWPAPRSPCAAAPARPARPRSAARHRRPGGAGQHPPSCPACPL
jgi:hypothetical protein